MEAILLLLYAWNSAPIPGTDISRCLVALGREFHFPIDFSADKHLALTSTPASVTSYSRDLATRLSALPLKTNKLIYWIKILLRYSYWISDALFLF